MMLYRINTAGLGEFYIVASDTHTALCTLRDMLSVADYGFSNDRAVESIDILANEIGEFPKGKPNFSSKDKLIISQ